MGRYGFRKRKPVDYTEKRMDQDLELLLANDRVRARVKEAALPEAEVAIVCIRDASITNKDGKCFKAEEIETANEWLTVSGVAADGSPITSHGLRDWSGLDLESECPMLGVSDGSCEFSLMTPNAVYVDFYYQSKAPVDFAAWLVQNAERKPTMSLEALTTEFLETDASLSMYATYKSSPKEFIKKYSINAGKLLQAHWGEQFPKVQSMKELNWLRFHCNFIGANIVGEQFEQYFIRQEPLKIELGERSCWERIQTAKFSKQAGKNVVRQRINSSNPGGFIELQVGTTKCFLRAGDFVRLKSDNKNLLTARIQSVNTKDRSAHVQQFCTARETLVGNIGSKWELFATHNCADIPITAIIEKLENVCLDGTRKVDQLFCRFETCSEYGFFQEYVVPARLTDGCRECKRAEDLTLYEKPIRIQESEIVQFRGEKWKIGDLITMSKDRSVYQPATKAISNRNAAQYMAQRPELWRFKEQKVIDHVQHLQGVAQITGLQFHDDDHKKPILTVRYVNRPEDIYQNQEVAREMHPNILLPSNQNRMIGKLKWNYVLGKAYVASKKHLMDVNSWLNQGPNRFFVQDELPENLLINALNPSGNAAPEYPKLPQADRLKLLDLFCGAGVLSYGLQEAGLAEISWGVDLNEDCTKSFKINFPNASALTMSVNEFLRLLEKGDSDDMNGEALPKRGEVGMICGGTPCQGFSLLNKHTDSAASEFNRMAIVSLLRTVEVLDPNYVMVENVPASARSEDGFFVKFLVNTLLQLGFQCRLNKFQSANFGVPQCRSRLIVLGAKLGQPMPEFPDNTHCTGKKYPLLKLNHIEVENPSIQVGAPFRQVIVTDAIGDLPFEAATDCKYKKPPANPFQAQMRKDSPPLIHHVTGNSSELHDKRISYIPENGNWTHIPNLQVELPSRMQTPKLKYVIRRGKPVVCPCHVNLVCEKNKLKRKYEGSLLPFALAHTADKNSHWSNAYGRIPSAGLFPSMTTSLHPLAKQGRVLHHTANRLLTVREMARAQAIPDSFKFYGRTKSMISQIGNAVPPPLTFHVAQKIVESILKQQKEAGDE